MKIPASEFAAFQYGWGNGYLQRILGYIGLFVIVNYVAKWGGRRNALLGSRHTVVGGTIHGVVTSFTATGVHLGLLDLSWWHRFALPLSMAYLITDILFYCVPKKDVMITIHHFVMMFTHFPSGVDESALLCSAGDAVWARTLSSAGYLSEVPNPLLNTRWVMLKTLKENNIVFTLNNIILLVSWVVTRLVILPSLLVTMVLPRASALIADGGTDLVVGLVLGHITVVAMSYDWLRKLVRGGLKPYLVFQPGAEHFNPNVTDAGGKRKSK